MAGKGLRAYSEPWFEALASSAGLSSEAADEFRRFIAETPAKIEGLPGVRFVGGTAYPRLADEEGRVLMFKWYTENMNCSFGYSSAEYGQPLLASLLHSPTFYVRASLVDMTDPMSRITHLEPFLIALRALNACGVAPGSLEETLIKGLLRHPLRIIESRVPPGEYLITSGIISDAIVCPIVTIAENCIIVIPEIK